MSGGSGIRAGKVEKTPGGDWYVERNELDLCCYLWKTPAGLENSEPGGVHGERVDGRIGYQKAAV